MVESKIFLMSYRDVKVYTQESVNGSTQDKVHFSYVQVQEGAILSNYNYVYIALTL